MIEKLKKYISCEGIDVRPSNLGGYGVFATKNLPTDLIVLKIPKKSVLSPQTSGIATDLAEHDDLGPANLLITAYLYEKSLGTKSKWYDYISMISHTDLPDIPSLWTPKEQELLTGSNVNLWVALDVTEMEEAYAETQDLLKNLETKLGVIDFGMWRDASLMISSRSFDVDNYHQLSLVPGACLFNHSDEESVHYETDGHVCGMCGSLSCDCVDSWEDDEEIPAEGEKGLVSVLGDDMAGDDVSEADIATDKAEDHDQEMDFEKSNSNVCEMRITRPVKAGEEVFNTYGNDPNGVLLSRYGFAIWNNAHDIVDFDTEVEELAHACKMTKKLKSWRRKQEEKMETMSDEDDSDELLFIGLINETEAPRHSLGLVSLAKYLKFDPHALARSLAKERYQKYSITGTSSEIRERLATEKSTRQRMAMIAVGTEKKMLESVLN